MIEPARAMIRALPVPAARARLSGLFARARARVERNLRARLLGPLVALTVAVLAGMVLAAVSIHRRALEAAQAERVQLFATLTAEAISNHMIEAGARALGSLVTELRAHRQDIYDIQVLDPEGMVVSAADRDRLGTTTWPKERLLRGGLTQVLGDSVAVVRPLYNEPRCAECHGYASGVNGYVDMRFANTEVAAASRHLASILAVAALVALVLLVGSSWVLLGHEAVKPIQNLVAAMRRAEGGDTQVRADNGRPDEFGVASRGFDDMLAALKKSQQVLQQVHEERMIKADRFAMIGQMATGLAHEIRNPLAGLSGALELLSDEMKDSPHRTEMLQEMQHQVSRLEGIMEGLLNFARPPRAQLRATQVNVALSKALFLMRQRRDVRVMVTAELTADLPTVHADAGQLEQVFLNLCLNAFQAMEGKEGTLTVRSFLRGDKVVVTIADTGPGIPPEVRPHLFTPFFTTRTNGTGLGLAMSARMLAQHGGQLEFECPESGGTVFSILLPTTPAPRADAS